MRSRASSAPISGRSRVSSGPLIAKAFQALVIGLLSGGIIWIVSIYASGLRDPRYFDGWVLAGGMCLQVGFHVAVKTARLSPKSAVMWRRLHILIGYVLIAVFLSHSDFSLPDTAFEWALWAGFVLVTLSGIFGIYLAWSLRTKRQVDESIGYDNIPARRAELARDADAVVTRTDPAHDTIALPALPHDAWIADLYSAHLRDYFQRPRNLAAHLIGSQRPLKQLTEEIDTLSRYVDQQSRDKLTAIKDLVIEKYRLDFARVHLGLTRAWLLVHVPITYALIVLSVLHVLVVYAYSSGAW